MTSPEATPEQLVFGSQFMCFMIADCDPTVDLHYLLRRTVPLYRRAKALHRRIWMERLSRERTYHIRCVPFLFENWSTHKADIYPLCGSGHDDIHAIRVVVDRNDGEVAVFCVEKEVHGRAMILTTRKAIYRNENLTWSCATPKQYDGLLSTARHVLESYLPTFTGPQKL